MMQRRKHMMSREKFISILFRQQQSGLSIADFCENEGYSRSRFYLWKQEYGITERELLAEAVSADPDNENSPGLEYIEIDPFDVCDKC